MRYRIASLLHAILSEGYDDAGFTPIGDGLEVISGPVHQDVDFFRDGFATFRHVTVTDAENRKGRNLQINVWVQTEEPTNDWNPPVGTVSVALRDMSDPAHPDVTEESVVLPLPLDPDAVIEFVRGAIERIRPAILAYGQNWRATREPMPAPRHMDAGKPFPSDPRDISNWKHHEWTVHGLTEWRGGGWTLSFTRTYTGIVDAVDPSGVTWYGRVGYDDERMTDLIRRICPDGKSFDMEAFYRNFR